MPGARDVTAPSARTACGMPRWVTSAWSAYGKATSPSASRVRSSVALAYAYAPMKRRTVVHLGVSVAMLVMMVALVGLKTSELTSAV